MEATLNVLNIITNRWVSECCLTPNEQFYSYITERGQLHALRRSSKYQFYHLWFDLYLTPQSTTHEESILTMLTITPPMWLIVNRYQHMNIIHIWYKKTNNLEINILPASSDACVPGVIETSTWNIIGVFNATLQYLHFIMVFSFIGGRNKNSWRKIQTSHKLLAYYHLSCIE